MRWDPKKGTQSMDAVVRSLENPSEKIRHTAKLCIIFVVGSRVFPLYRGQAIILTRLIKSRDENLRRPKTN
jgi:hypothetical protein